MDPTWYMGHRLKIRWRSTVDRKSLGTKIVTAEESDKIYPWGWIRWKVDLIKFAKSARTSQSESVWSRGIHHNLVLSCSPNPAGANPLPFWSSPSFQSKTRVHASPLSKYDGQEFKNEFTWWLSWRARARVVGPSGAGDGVGVGVVLMASSKMIPSLWYVWCKPCNYLAVRWTLSPDRPKWASTWPTSPRSSTRCSQKDLRA
jgi:hypothetical protein